MAYYTWNIKWAWIFEALQHFGEFKFYEGMDFYKLIPDLKFYP